LSAAIKIWAPLISRGAGPLAAASFLAWPADLMDFMIPPAIL
jgi:hypothetical protein